MKPDMGVKIGGLKLKNPVLVASGTFGYGDEFKDYVDVSGLGGIITKTVTLRPRPGNPPPRVYETTGGMLNAIGLQNDGLENFVKEKLPKLRGLGTKAIVSVGGETQEEYRDIVRALSAFKEIDAFELNISCPNVAYKHKVFAHDVGLTRRLVAAARRATRRPLIVKLSPNVCDVTAIALAAQEGGADAVSLVNTFLAMAVDVEKRRSVLTHVTGGLSGPAIKPIALRMAWQVYQKIKVPVIGMGGIMDSRDALEFMIAGAAAVAVGTANFVTPQASLEIVEGIRRYLARHGLARPRELTGSLNTK
jgi:dihydroorotate dehydrogenase (NAD+) catalytic subunit